MNTLQLRSYALVGIQFTCVGTLAYLTLSVPLSAVAIIMITLAMAIALWAIFTMQFGNLRIQPIPKTNARLVTSGPYAFVRHPMYSAVLAGCLGLAINVNTLPAYAALAVLVFDLWIKLRLEEQLLLKHFDEYQEYIGRTKRLLPFLW